MTLHTAFAPSWTDNSASQPADGYDVARVEVEPEWRKIVQRRLREIETLPARWDCYGARRVNPLLSPQVVGTLHKLMRSESPIPDVVPTVRGGIQVEWHAGEFDIELEFVTPSQIEVYALDLRTNQVSEFAVTYDVGAVAMLVSEMTDRRSGS